MHEIQTYYRPGESNQSVLGATTEQITSAETDLNSCTKAGITYYWGNIQPAHSPFSWGAMDVMMKVNGNVVQICRYRESDPANRKIVWRSYESNTWSNWIQIYDESMLTNSALLSPLASALGGKLKVVYVSQSVAANGVIEIPSARAGIGCISSSLNNVFDEFYLLPDSATSLRTDQGGWKATYNSSSVSGTLCIYKDGSKLCVKNTSSESAVVTVAGFMIF